MKNRVAACTIVSRNYAAYARTLQESLRRSNPDINFYVLVVDRKDAVFERQAGFDNLLWVEDLGIPNFLSMAFKFDILELNTDVKPFMLQRLAKQYEYFFYLDPDIYVYGTLDGLVHRLEGQTAIITPHAISPINDDKKPSEIDFLKSGTYNLGFFGARACPETQRLLEWWGQRCYALGYNDARQGLFVDQRLIDLVPSFFDGVVIERSPAYNVAYWNLHERTITDDHETPQVNGIPLIFFHFSGLSVDPSTEPRLEISKYQNRSNFKNRPDVNSLFDNYRRKLIEQGHREFQKLTYGFGQFSNGERINNVSRRLYGLVDESFGDSVDPFDNNGPVYRMLARRKALGGLPRPAPSTFNVDRKSNALRAVQSFLRLGFRLLGPERYAMLMTYFGYISSIRNQKEIFFENEHSK